MDEESKSIDHVTFAIASHFGYSLARDPTAMCQTIRSLDRKRGSLEPVSGVYGHPDEFCALLHNLGLCFLRISRISFEGRLHPCKP